MRLTNTLRDEIAEMQLIKDFSEKVQTYNDAYENVRGKVYSILDSVTTKKKLLEIWPDVTSFYTFVDDVAPSTGLSVPVGDLVQQIKAIKGD